VRAAVEDIGLADPQALVQALAAKDMYDFLGSPEGEIALAQTVLYLASAPKSNAVYTALGAAKRAAQDHGSLMPPAHILNAPTKLMKNLGYGKGYEYDHAAEEGFSGQNYLPDGMARESYYVPRDTGFEREIAKRMEYWAKLRAKRNQGA
jgi:putative ATPase